MIPCTKILKGERSAHNSKTAGPLFIWNLTSRCNLRCAHCYRDSGQEVSAAGLEDEKCIELAVEIRKLNPPIVLLSGGEPLLRDNIFEIINACKENGMRVGLSTNGTLIDACLADKIRRAGVDYAGISIDGESGLHDRFRGVRGSSNASWQAIRLLNERGVKTGVRFTVTDENSAQFRGVLEEALRSGAKRFCLYHLVYSGRATEKLDMPAAEKRKFMRGFFNKVKELALSNPDFDVLTTDNPADGIFLPRFADDKEAVFSCLSGQGGCSAGERVVYLDSDGEVYPCQFLRRQPLGNVTLSPLVEIWKNSANRFLAQLRGKTYFLEGRCGSCAHKKICGGCRARALAYHGSLWAEDPACYLQEEEINKIMESRFETLNTKH